MSKQKAAKIAGQWWGARLQKGDQSKFADEVERRTLDALMENHFVKLSTDYDPEGILLDALHAIGIECDGYFFSCDGILPKKHLLIVSEDEIRQKQGYGNWKETIALLPARPEETMTKWKKYNRKAIPAEMRPYESGEDLEGVSVGESDIQNGSPKQGDMIARDPENHQDQWLVNADYFQEKFDTTPVS